MPLGLALWAVLTAGCEGEKFEGGEGGEASGGTSGSGPSGGSSSGGTSGGEPADVSGTYTVAITNASVDSSFESCPLSGVMVGTTSTGVMVTINQSGSTVMAALDWVTSLGVSELLGSNVNFAGSVTGNDVEMVAFGTKVYTEGTCTYTMNSVMNATLQGNALEGTTSYEMIPGADGSCASLVCEGVQEFSGSRPPR